MKTTAEISELVRSLLASQRFAVIATQSEGQPYSNLVAFTEADNLRSLLFVTSRHTKKYSNTIANNSLYQGATIVGSDTYVYKNAGFRTETRGSATVAAGNTSVTVNHGLAITPPLDAITITPSSGLSTASTFYITNATATTFDIGLNSAPAAPVGFVYSINNVRLGY